VPPGSKFRQVSAPASARRRPEEEEEDDPERSRITLIAAGGKLTVLRLRRQKANYRISREFEMKFREVRSSEVY
jgi:hypothetical protein